MIAAISLSAALAGCASTGTSSLGRDPGPAPSYLTKVQVATPQPGESPYVVAKRRGQALDMANARIECARQEREATRSAMMAGRVAAQNDACLGPVMKTGGRR